MDICRQVSIGDLLRIGNFLPRGVEQLDKRKGMQHHLVVRIVADFDIIVEVRQIPAGHLVKAEGHALHGPPEVSAQKEGKVNYRRKAEKSQPSRDKIGEQGHTAARPGQRADKAENNGCAEKYCRYDRAYKDLRT